MFFPRHWTRKPAPWDSGVNPSQALPTTGFPGLLPDNCRDRILPEASVRKPLLFPEPAECHQSFSPSPPVFSSALPAQNYTLILIQEFSHSDYTDPPSRRNEHTIPHPIAAWGLLELPALFRTLTMYAANAMTAPGGLPQPRAQRAASWDMKEGEECSKVIGHSHILMK